MVQARSLPAGIVTFLFTDIEGSTGLLRRLGARYGDVLERHRQLLRGAWHQHDGHEVNTEGDAFLVAFANATYALRGCADAQRAVESEAWPADGVVRVRMGLHLGMASPRNGDYVALAVHQAARVVTTAHGGQVVATQDVADQVGPLGDLALRPLGRFRLRDFDDPVALFQLHGAGLASEFPAVRALPADRHNLAHQPTRFVDRDPERSRLADLARPGRLLTVVGAGGVGKSRLAIEVGTANAPAWDDGVWLVDLAPLAAGEEIPGAISSALGVPAPAQVDLWHHVLDQLRRRRCLLVLDNCEHLIAPMSARAAEVLASCPEVGMLATSREPLGIGGEVVVRVEPLAVPSQASDVTAIGAAAAIELFVDRARAVQPDFQLDEGTAAVCARICQRLDGLPLAIELAAARIGVMSPAEILRGLDDRFRLLRARDRTTPDRHRTMEALLDWSYRLLSPAEQPALRSSALFASGFSIDMAAAAGAPLGVAADDAGDLVWSLVDKSLVATEVSASGTRYRLHESVRAYGRRLLDERGETSDVARAAAQGLLALVGPWLPMDRTWVGEAAAQLENLRALVGLVAPTDPETAQLIAWSVGRYHDSVHAFREGTAALDRYLAELPEPSGTRVVLLTDLGFLHLRLGDVAAAIEALRAAESLFAEVGSLPAWDDVAIERLRGEIQNRQRDFRAAIATARRALEAGPSLRGESRMSNLLGLASLGLGDLDQAFDAFERELQAMEQLDYELYVASAHGNLAEVALQQGRSAVAARHQRACLELGLAVGAPVMVAYSLIVASRLAAESKAWDLAVRLHTRAEAILAETGYAMYSDDVALSDAMLTDAADHLGADRFASERSAGSGLELTEAVASARTVFDRLVPA